MSRMLHSFAFSYCVLISSLFMQTTIAQTVDLDIDSLNVRGTNFPGCNLADPMCEADADLIEDAVAKVIYCNDDDDDCDLVRDYEYDGVIVLEEGELVPIRLTIADPGRIGQGCSYRIVYNSSNVRIWGSPTRGYFSTDVISSGNTYNHTIRLLGDMDCSGTKDESDISPFTRAIVNPAQWELDYSGCDINAGDINGDGNFNSSDISPFSSYISSHDLFYLPINLWVEGLACSGVAGHYETITVEVDYDNDGQWDTSDEVVVANASRTDGIPHTHGDCNLNSISDFCDISDGFSQDCNLNGIPDDCDITNGTSSDSLQAGVPDECSFGFVDVDVDSDLDNETDMPDRSAHEDAIENAVALPGKIIFINYDDDNMDGETDSSSSSHTVVGEDDLVPVVCDLEFGPYLSPGDSLSYQLRVEGEARDQVAFWNSRERGDSSAKIDHTSLALRTHVARILGDMNGNHTLEGGVGGDLEAFDLALSDPALFVSTYALDPVRVGDMNSDGWLSSLDRPLLESVIQNQTISHAPMVMWIEAKSITHWPPESDFSVTLQFDINANGLIEATDPSDTVRMQVWKWYLNWCGYDNFYSRDFVDYYGMPLGVNVNISAPVPSSTSFLGTDYRSRCWNDRMWRKSPLDFGNESGDTLEPGFGANLDVTHGTGTWDLPPLSTNVFASTAALVPADARDTTDTTRFAERVVVGNTLDAITSMPLIAASDFELPFGGAVFRHIRTYSERYGFFPYINRTNDSCSGGTVPSGACTYVDPLAQKWDWNGLNWAISESPLFLIDAQYKNYVSPGPKRCYFIPDAHHAIPFEFIEATDKYVAPPWFDATLTYEDYDGDDRIDTFYVWMYRNSVKYTIKPIYEDLWVEKNEQDEWVHAHESPANGGPGMPYQGLVTQIEDRYGNTVEYEYCDFRQFPCAPDFHYTENTDNDCQSYCQNCEQKGMLRSIRLRDADGNVVWTLAYTYRSFYPIDSLSPLHGLYVSGGLDAFASQDQDAVQHAMLHSIHVYSGDQDLSGYGCSVIPPARFSQMASFDEYDAVDVVAEGYVPNEWEREVRYMYQDPLDVQTWTCYYKNCPDVTQYPELKAWDDYHPYRTANNFVQPGALLLKVTVTSRSDTDDNKQTTIYAYNNGSTMDFRPDMSFPELQKIINNDTIAEYIETNMLTGDHSENEILHQPFDSMPYDIRISDVRKHHNENTPIGAWLNDLQADIGLDPAITNSDIHRRLTLNMDGEAVEYQIHQMTTTNDGSNKSISHLNPRIHSLYHYPYRFVESVNGDLKDATYGLPDFSDTRFVTVIDELREVDGAYNATSLKGVRTRRIIEMNPAGLVLRDRTYEVRPGALVLEAHLGYAETLKHDCKGRLLERRTTGWSVAEGLGLGDVEGLIYVNEYHGDSHCYSSPQALGCSCPVDWSANIDEPVGELKASGIKRGTSGTIYYTRSVVREPGRSELIASEIEFFAPTTDLASTNGQLTTYTYTFADKPGVPEKDRAVVGKVIRKEALPLAQGGTPYFSTEEEIYSNKGELIWERLGSEDTGGTFSEAFIKHKIHDKKGRVVQEVFDAHASPSDGAYQLPDGWQRLSVSEPLDHRTLYTYKDPFGVSKIQYPNGSIKHIVYDMQGSDAYVWNYLVGSDGSTLLEPVEVNYYRGGQQEFTKRLTGPALSGEPQALDLDNLPAGWEILAGNDVEYNEAGQPTSVTTTSGDGSSSIGAHIYYHATGEPSAIYEPDGTVKRYTYNTRGRLEKTYRGTDDAHEYWGTAVCDSGLPDCGFTDDLTLIEKRSYGEGINDADKLVEVRKYDYRPTDQYFLCDPDVDPECAINDEDLIGWSTQHLYDWRMREAWVKEYNKHGMLISNTLTWYDNQDHAILVARYGSSVPAGVDPTAIAAGQSDQGVIDSSVLPTILAAIATNPPLSLTQTVYNWRGLEEEVRSYNCGDPMGSYTVTRTYYNAFDLPSEVHAVNSPPKRHEYDAKKRAVTTYELFNTQQITRTETEYDSKDKPTLRIQYERTPSGTGDVLDSSNSVITYTYVWHDDAGRIIANVKFGTNEATFTNGAAPPAYDSMAVPVTYGANGNITSCDCSGVSVYAQATCYSYDEAGRQLEVWQPNRVVTRTEYDDLGQVILLTENATDRDGDGLIRYTAYKYDDKGRLEAMAAVTPEHFGGGAADWASIVWTTDNTIQVTRFYYDAVVVPANWQSQWNATAGSWDVYVTNPGDWQAISGNNALLSRVEYPDGEMLDFTYYPDESVAAREDSKGNRFYYEYNERGLVTSVLIDDSVFYSSTAPEAPANRIHRIVYAYEADDLLATATAYSYDQAGVELQVSHSIFMYDARRNLISETQSYLGYLPSTVEYDWNYYDHSSGNRSILSSITYPRTGTGLAYQYNGWRPDDVTSIAWDGSRLTYAYMHSGSGRRVKSTYGINVVTQTFGEDADGFSRLDTHGRIKDLYWQLSTPGDYFRYVYGYDTAGNRTHARVDQSAPSMPRHFNEHSWVYEYDALQRLVFADMGRIDDGASPAVIVPTVNVRQDQFDWRLDLLGNWVGDDLGAMPGLMRTLDLNGDGAPDHTYGYDHTVDYANQLDSVTFDNGTTSTTITQLQDRAGNLVYDGKLYYQYDAFNRLVSVHEAASLIPATDLEGDFSSPTFNRLIDDTNLGPMLLHMTYDALGRLVQTQRSDMQGKTSTETYGYDGTRRLYESDYSLSKRVVREYVYSPNYVDELIGVTETVFRGRSIAAYVLNDANYNVVAIVRNNGIVLQQHTWDPYGQLVAIDTNASAPLLPSTRVGHQGLFYERLYHVSGQDLLTDPALAPYDPTAGQAPTGVYYNRNRWYSPALGRFLQTDMNGSGMPLADGAAFNGIMMNVTVGAFSTETNYYDGMNLYLYLGANPLNATDAEGLFRFRLPQGTSAYWSSGNSYMAGATAGFFAGSALLANNNNEATILGMAGGITHLENMMDVALGMPMTAVTRAAIRKIAVQWLKRIRDLRGRRNMFTDHTFVATAMRKLRNQEYDMIMRDFKSRYYFEKEMILMLNSLTRYYVQQVGGPSNLMRLGNDAWLDAVADSINRVSLGGVGGDLFDIGAGRLLAPAHKVMIHGIMFGYGYRHGMLESAILMTELDMGHFD